MRGFLALLILASALAGLPSASAGCAPPCGPAPAVIDIIVEKTTDLAFEDQEKIVLTGTVSFFVDADFNGYYADPQENPELTLLITRTPAWVKAKVEPSTFVVPLNDPTYLQADGPEQVAYYWESPITLTLTRVRDPTPEELAPGSKEIRRDGTARVLVIATSTPTYIGKDLLGPSVGVQEGYGARELRMIPERDGVKYYLDSAGVLRPGGAPPPAHEAPAVGIVALLALAGAFVRRRR